MVNLLCKDRPVNLLCKDRPVPPGSAMPVKTDILGKN